MKHRGAKGRKQRSGQKNWLPGLVILGGAFLLGSVGGCLIAGGTSVSEGMALSGYLEGYLQAVRDGTLLTPSLLTVALETLRWPLMAFLLSFTAVGLLGLPVLFGVRGFLLGFAVASFIRVLGDKGVALALLLFGMTGLLSLPALFLLGEQGMAACRVLAIRLTGDERKAPVYSFDFFRRCGLCGAALLLSIGVEHAVVPALMTVIAGTL